MRVPRVQRNHSMRNARALVGAAILGTVATLGVEAAAQSTKPACSSSSDMSRLYKRLDDLERAITTLQTQSAKVASDNALANSNNQRQLANISSQVGDLNTQIVALTGSIRR